LHITQEGKVLSSILSEKKLVASPEVRREANGWGVELAGTLRLIAIRRQVEATPRLTEGSRRRHGTPNSGAAHIVR
jgi:hypothetical protein